MSEFHRKYNYSQPHPPYDAFPGNTWAHPIPRNGIEQAGDGHNESLVRAYQDDDLGSDLLPTDQCLSILTREEMEAEDPEEADHYEQQVGKQELDLACRVAMRDLKALAGGK